MAESAAKTKFPLRTAFVCLLLLLVTAGIYWQLRHAPFVVYDDDQYVRENTSVNAGLSWAGVKWAFAGGHEANWHPLTWLSHMLDCQWFGLDAGKHHLVNLAWHIANSLLLFGLMRYLTGAFWRSAMVAALFAWHPMHVESVAWIAERKDVLSTFFWLLTIFAYAAYCKSPGISADKSKNCPSEIKTRRSKYFYLLAIFLFALSLMSKPMVVTLPFLLLLLDYWPLQRRTSWRHLFTEKLPLITLSLISCFVTYVVQARDGAMGNLVIAPGIRLVTAFTAYVRYAGKLIWPTKLAVFYPYDFAPPIWQTVGVFILMIVISSAAIFLVRRQPCVFVGWFWFLGTLVPVIGLVQVGKQSMADRYSYVPALGLFIAVVWLAEEVVARRPAFKMVVIGTAVFALIGCVVVAAKQVDYWQSSELLFRHALDVTTDNEASEYNLAFTLFGEGKMEEAAVRFENSLRMQPNQSTAECNLGLCLSKLGKEQEAIVHFQNALRLDDHQWATHLDYGLSLQKLGDTNAALAQFREAVRLNPAAYKARFSLGEFYLNHGRYTEAKQEFEETVRLDPDETAPHQKLAATLSLMGQTAAAIEEYQAVLRINADAITALNDLAWIRATSADPSFRNGAEAVRLARHACELAHYEEPMLIGTLADAYAEAGQFKEAEDAAVKARDLALTHHLKNVADKNEELLQIYRSHQAYHEKAATN